MEDIIITTPERLQSLINNSIRSVFPELVNYINRDKIPGSDNLDGAQAASDFLKQQGFDFSRGSIYGLVYQGRIPYSKFGRKIMFSKKRLLEWTKSEMKAPNRTTDASEAITKSALRKEQ